MATLYPKDGSHHRSHFIQRWLTCSRSEVEGSRTNGRIRNILFDFGAFLAISQNTLIPVSHVLENLIEKLKNWPFAKIENCQILAKYETLQISSSCALIFVLQNFTLSSSCALIFVLQNFTHQLNTLYRVKRRQSMAGRRDAGAEHGGKRKWRAGAGTWRHALVSSARGDQVLLQ